MVGRQLTPSFGSSLTLEVEDSEVKVMPVESMGSCFAKGSSMSSPLSAVKDMFLVLFDVWCWCYRENERFMTQENKWG